MKRDAKVLAVCGLFVILKRHYCACVREYSSKPAIVPGGFDVIIIQCDNLDFEGRSDDKIICDESD